MSISVHGNSYRTRPKHASCALIPSNSRSLDLAAACTRGDKGEADLRADLVGLAQVSPAAVCRDDAPVMVRSPQRTYTLLRLLAVGDMADLHLARATDDPTAAECYALKVSRIPGGHVFL